MVLISRYNQIFLINLKILSYLEIFSNLGNYLGNLYYYKANSFLDQQDVTNAKKSWEKAREYYKNSLEIDTNASVQNNLESLNDQIRDRIEPLISKIEGLVWRDINGNGRWEENEPRLKATIFWDKNDDGEIKIDILYRFFELFDLKSYE